LILPLKGTIQNLPADWQNTGVDRQQPIFPVDNHTGFSTDEQHTHSPTDGVAFRFRAQYGITCGCGGMQVHPLKGIIWVHLRTGRIRVHSLKGYNTGSPANGQHMGSSTNRPAYESKVQYTRKWVTYKFHLQTGQAHTNFTRKQAAYGSTH